MTDYQRIEQVLKFLNMTARSLAFSIGLKSPQIFYDIKAGKCGISKSLAESIQEHFLNISTAWLLTGEGEMLKSDSNENSANVEKIDDESSDDLVPLLPVDAVAGTLQGFADGVELASCQKIKSPVKGADWAIRVSGDSMEPDYKNGSYLFIRKMTGGMIPWGQTLVLDTYDGVVVKNIYPLDEDSIEARSINPKYPPFSIEKSLIIGMYRVLGGTFINSTI